MNAKKSLANRIRGWFPQKPEVGVTIQDTAPLTKTNLKPLNKEDVKEIEKSVIKSIGVINLGIFSILETLWSFALDDSYFNLNAVGNTELLVGMFGLGSFLIIFGTLYLKTYDESISFKGRLKFLEIIPNATGYVLMGIGTYVASFYISRPLPKSIPDFYSWHPFATQGFEIYSIGIAVILATFLLYHYLIPKQITARLTDTRTS